MSNIFGAPRAGAPNGPDEARSVPKGDIVGSYNSYLDAQKAVDYLADQQFPVQMVSIVGNDLKMVERVTGRLTYPRVALSGALSGMWFGLFVGVMLSFFSTTPGYFSIVTSVLMGAAFFMLFGIVTYAMQRGKRDFTSTSQVVATNYDVVVSFEAANEARRLLHQLPMTQHDASASAGTAGYSQRDYQHQPYQPGPGQGSEDSRAMPRSAPRAGTTPTASGLPNPADSPPADGSPATSRPPASEAGPPRQPAGSADAAPDEEEAAKPCRVLPIRTSRTAARSTGSASPTRQAGARPGRLAALIRQPRAGNAEGLLPE